MAPVNPAQLGSLYDILVATRDGTTLPCVNRNGVTVNVSQIAYMLSTTKPSSRATELQRKDQLVQLSSAQVIDREHNSWPQVEQGTWEDGQGQRVFSGQGEALGTVSNKSTAYWDGLGVLWPIQDYLPQKPILVNPDQAESGAIMQNCGTGVVGGEFLSFVSGALPAYAYAYMQNSAPQHNILAIQTANNLRKIDPIPGSTNGVNDFLSVDYLFAFGYFWLVTLNAAANQLTISSYGDGAPPGIVDTTTFAIAGNLNDGVKIAAGRVGNKQYVAVTYALNLGSVLQPTMRVYDMTRSSGAFPSGFVDVQLGDITYSSAPLQLGFYLDNIIVSMQVGDAVVLSAYNIPSQTWSTLAQFPHVTHAGFVAIAGELFVVTYAHTSPNGIADTADMYLLQGSSLQHIGPVQIQSSGVSYSNALAGCSEPVAFGPYAVFAAYYRPSSLTTTSIQVFAYDVLRGRLFKLQDFGGYNILLRPDNAGRKIAMVAPATRPTPVGTLNCQWMPVVPVLSQSASAQDVSNAQGMAVGISTNTFGSAFIQQGVQITSSLIDFTSNENKLYRQIVASFTPLPNDVGITVQLDAWFDQDPSNLALVPDFTTGAVAAGVNGGVTGQVQLKLVCNKIARKVVYRATTTGPTAGNGAVKVITVAVQSATGWALHYFLDVTWNALANDGQTPAYRNQDQIDEFVAHSFLEKLWRLKGGECTVTLPTGGQGGESFPALLQLVSAESVKFVTPSTINNQYQQHNVIVEIKLREDV